MTTGRFRTEYPWDTEGVLADIGVERERQDVKWGPQVHPDGTSDNPYLRSLRDRAIEWCNQSAKLGVATWKDILTEEVYEAFAEDDIAMLRSELVQVAAVAVAWIEDLDRRKQSEDGPYNTSGGHDDWSLE